MVAKVVELSIVFAVGADGVTVKKIAESLTRAISVLFAINEM